MKKLVLLLSMMFVVTLGFSQLNKQNNLVYTDQGDLFTGTYVEYYDNGNQKVKADFKEGLKDGKVITFFADGTKENLFTYKAGVFDGVCKSWDFNGTLTGIAFYDNGIKDGKWEIYMDGKLKYEIYYEDGKKVNAVRPTQAL